MMTCESSTKLRSMKTPISPGVEIEVCASVEQQGPYRHQRKGLYETNDEPSKRPLDLGNGKLAERASTQREATESG